MEYAVQDVLLMFFLYGFLGWCLEVAFCGVKEGHFINRGFLNGPICPIYGVGGTVVVMCLTPLKGNVVLLYICSVILTSLLELATGYVLERIYHVRWWDYSDEKLNIGGYICLKFSLAWGIACTALMYVLHPLLYDTVIYHIPAVVKNIIIIVLGAVLIADLIATVAALRKLRIRVEAIDNMAKRLHEISDEIGENIYEKAEQLDDLHERISDDERVKQLVDEVRKFREKQDQRSEQFMEELERKREESADRLRKEAAELREKYEEKLAERRRFQERILKAFPKMRSHRHESALKKLAERRYKK